MATWSVCLSVCLFVCLSVFLFVCSSVCLFVCLSVCLFCYYLNPSKPGVRSGSSLILFAHPSILSQVLGERLSLIVLISICANLNHLSVLTSWKICRKYKQIWTRFRLCCQHCQPFVTIYWQFRQDIGC